MCAYTCCHSKPSSDSGFMHRCYACADATKVHRNILSWAAMFSVFTRKIVAENGIKPRYSCYSHSAIVKSASYGSYIVKLVFAAKSIERVFSLQKPALLCSFHSKCLFKGETKLWRQRWHLKRLPACWLRFKIRYTGSNSHGLQKCACG